MREKELQKLHKTIISCKKCPLYKTRKNAVPGEGLAYARIMFVGEGPGKWEDIQGRPFVGNAGKILDQLLKSINLDRKKVFITSVIKCRPVIGKRNRTPKRIEIETCKPYLEKQMEIIKPKIIVTLGNYGLQTILDKSFKISKVHGKIQKKNGIIVFPTFHPAAALRFPKIRKIMEQDFKRLVEVF